MAATKGLQVKHLDRRVAERYVRRGVVSDKDFKQHVKDLPDLEGQYEVIVLPEGVGADDDDEDDGDEAAAS